MLKLWNALNAESPNLELFPAVPGFAILRNFLPKDVRARFIELAQTQLAGDWHVPKTRSGLSFSVKIACFGWRWTAQGYEPPNHLMPREIVEWSRRAANRVFMQYGDWSPQTAICNWYGRESKLGLHVDRQEDPATINAGMPIVTFSFGDDAELAIRLNEKDKLTKVVIEDSDAFVMGGMARSAEHGILRIKPLTGPKIGKAKEGRLSITVRQVTGSIS
jgi:alkylated DNA repair dioxygenase AlkB